MKKLLLLLLCLPTQCLLAQKDAPKWVSKAKQAVFSIATYDKDDRLASTGNGFFISEDGVAISDYTLFKNAQRAVIITFEGKRLPVESIMGANDMYDVVKFRVHTEKKAPGFLPVAPTTPGQDDIVYLLPYSTQKDRSCTQGTIKEVSSLPGGSHYYTLSIGLNEKQVSCPIVNEEGEAVGIVQAGTSHDTNENYAIGCRFAMDLSIDALSVNNATLNSIGIRKALPPTEDQALVYLMLSSSALDTDAYAERLNDFIGQFPNSAEGYIRRATHYIYNYKDEAHFSQAEADLDKALSLTEQKEEVHYNKAKLIYANQTGETSFAYKDWGYEKALREIDKALEYNSLPLYQQLKGDLYFALQRYPEAYECYEKVNQGNLASPESFYSAAQCKVRMQADGSEIIALMDSAISRFRTPYPEEAAPYLLERAQQKEGQNLFREAVADYDEYYQAVRGTVNDVFYYYREQANYKARNFKRALEDIQKALELSPDNVSYLAEAGAVNLRIARYDEAVGHLQKALAIDPGFAACYRLMGFCQMQSGEKEKACENFAKAKELGDEAVDSLIQKNCQP